MFGFDEEEQPQLNNNTETQEIIIPSADIRLSQDVTYTIGIDNNSKTVANSIGVSAQGTELKFGVHAVLTDKKPSVNFSGQIKKENDNVSRLALQCQQKHYRQRSNADLLSNKSVLWTVL